jgi:hypothetical protein
MWSETVGAPSKHDRADSLAGDAKTFSRDDARELARIMPVAARSGCLLRLLPDIAIRAKSPGSINGRSRSRRREYPATPVSGAENRDGYRQNGRICTASLLSRSIPRFAHPRMRSCLPGNESMGR